MFLTDLAPDLNTHQLAYLRARLESAMLACYLAADEAASYWDDMAYRATGDELADVIA